MSYCRNNGVDSDVYVIGTRNPDTKQNILQCFCKSAVTSFTSRSQMTAHLREHQRNGDKVPESAFERLRLEIGSEGDTV